MVGAVASATYGLAKDEGDEAFQRGQGWRAQIAGHCPQARPSLTPFTSTVGLYMKVLVHDASEHKGI